VTGVRPKFTSPLDPPLTPIGGTRPGLEVGRTVVGGAGLAHNESVVVARRASQRAELDRETVSSRLLATVTVPARRVAVTAAL